VPESNDLSLLLSVHGPTGWARELTVERAQALLQDDGGLLQMIVMAADIRASTLLMKEAVDLHRFAGTIRAFVNAVRDVTRDDRAWFDKFTGDGFLAYWVVDQRSLSEYFKEVLSVTSSVLNVFRKKAEPSLRKNSRNFPAGVGISVGLDAGPTCFAEIAGDLTIVGPAVVGAVRMVGCAEPYEAVANVYLAERLLEQRDLLHERGVTLEPKRRATKEYESGQQVFAFGFTRPL
jgi:class 3 adenylate cyclase